MIAPLAVHFLISLMLVVKAVSSTAQWKTLRAADMAASKMSRRQAQHPINVNRSVRNVKPRVALPVAVTESRRHD